MNQFENNFNDGAYKWDAFNNHASVPPRTAYTEPRFNPNEFKAGIAGWLQIGKYHVDIFLSNRQNSTVEPTPENVSIHILGVYESEQNEYNGFEIYKQVKAAVIEAMNNRVLNNVEMLNGLKDY